MRSGWQAARAVATAVALTAASLLGTAAPGSAATGGGHLVLSTTSLSFHAQRVATAWRSVDPLRLTNDGDATLQLRSMTLTGDLAHEFWLDSRCPAALAPGETCSVVVWRAPLGGRARAATLSIAHDGTNRERTDVSVWGPGTGGYYVASPTGKVYGFGDAAKPDASRSNPPAIWETPFALNSGILDLEATPTGDGVWLVGGDGGIFTFGDAAFFGSTGDLRLNRPIVGMAATPTGRGYWLAASDGGIFTFGDAAFFGSTGDVSLNQPIVGMASTTSGRGYWLVASDGGVFSFGDAGFFGSTGDIRLNEPIVGMARTPRSDGYWMVAVDGGVFTFGAAAFHGSAPIDRRDPFRPKERAVGMAVAPGGTGYFIGYAQSTVDAFGDVGGDGGSHPPSLAAIAPTAPVMWWPDPRPYAAVREASGPPLPPSPTMGGGTIG